MTLAERQDELVRLLQGDAVDPAQRRFGASLLDKRQGELERVVPLTAAVAPDIGWRYRCWLAENPAPHADRVLGPGLAEGLRSLDVLRASLADPPWAGDLFAWEICGRASRTDGVVRTLTAGWAVHDAARAIAAGYAPDPDVGRHDYVFERLGRAVPERAARTFAAERPLFGIGWRRTFADSLGEPEVLEVVPDHFFADPAGIEALADRFPIVLHDLGCSVATEARDAARLARLRDLVRRSRPLLFSDHLALTRSPSGIDLGHLCPVFRTREQLRVVVDRVRELQDTLGIPIALENIAAPFDLPGELEEEEFVGELVRQTGCGLLIDVTNALYDARNAGTDAWERLSKLPLEAAVQVHLAGGRADALGWVDTHGAAVEDESYTLLQRLRDRAPLVAVIVERDAHLPPASVLLAEAARAREIWFQPLL